MKRPLDDPFVFPPARCALGAFVPPGCTSLWEKWCRHCNLVYCAEHVAAEKHVCPRRPSEVAVTAVVFDRPKTEPMTDVTHPPPRIEVAPGPPPRPERAKRPKCGICGKRRATHLAVGNGELGKALCSECAQKAEKT